MTDLKESASSNRHWIDYTEYGTDAWNAGRPVKVADRAAVVSYNDSRANLDVNLRTDSGKLTVNTYGQSTTASGETLGDAEGYLKSIEIQEGTSGTLIKQRDIEYKTSDNTSGEKAISVGETTWYRDDAGTEAVVTGYAYQWYANGSQKEMVMTLPVVPVSQNGDGTSATTKSFYDQQGNMTFVQDERGIVDKQTFDADTQLMVKSQRDVPQSESGLPSGWTVGGTTPHFNATTDYEHDDLGRQIQMLGPKHFADIGGLTAHEIRHAVWNVYVDSISSDQIWTGQGYQKVSDGSFTLIDPVQILFRDKNGKVTDRISSKRSTGSGKLEPTDTFLRSDWRSWTVTVYSTVGLKEYERGYQSIPSQSPDLGLAGILFDPGTAGVNYEEEHFGYDLETNLLVRHLAQDKTITRTVYDPINRPLSVWKGTDDGGVNWDSWSPSNPGNLKKVTDNQYDSGAAGGNSNVTRITQFADDNTVRETNIVYDFRNRQIPITDPLGRVTVPTYNNRNEVTKVERYDSDPNMGGTLIDQNETFFDNRGRQYKTQGYEVNPETGAIGNYLLGQMWYDPAGNVIKETHPNTGILYVKHEYNNLGDRTRTYIACEINGNEVIIVDNISETNDISQLLSATVKQLDTDADPNNLTYRSSYNANWYDGVGRSFTAAAYGTNSGNPFTRPDVAPARSDDVLVTSNAFDDAGRPFSQTDPKGIENRQVYDDLSRPVKQIDNYQASGSGTDVNRTTEMTYTAIDQLKTITAKMTNPADDQVTIRHYGVTTADGSGINSNSILSSIEYPDGLSMEMKVNRLGETIETKDQNGTIHQLGRDLLGRPISDAIPTVGSGVDDTVRRQTYGYDSRDNMVLQTSHSEISDSTPGNKILNQLEQVYNDFNQLIDSWQEHDGAVNTEPQGASPRVRYSYASGSENGQMTNQIRPESITYPDGRKLDFNYGPTGSITDCLNQILAIKEGSTDLVQYKYLGQNQPVVVDYDEPNVKLDLWGGTVGTYDGLDNFGRVIDQRWLNYSASPVDVVRLEYGYDRDSNPTYRRDTVAHALSKGFDELYELDGLNRLIDYQRGLLNTGNTAINTLSFQQDWSLDQVRNWTGFNQDDNGNGTSDLVQIRDHNQVNEIDSIATKISGSWTEPSYDNAGNTTTFPKPEQPVDGFTAIYDAWNRQVCLNDEATGTKVAEYSYDAANRRIQKHLHNSLGVHNKTIDSYYTSGWQNIEEHETHVGGSSSSSSNSGSGTIITQTVYGLRYTDDIVCRDRTNIFGSTSRQYYLSTRRFSIAAIIDLNGNVLERYAYTPYGERLVLDANFNSRSTTFYNNYLGYLGLLLDSESHLIYNRNRILHPILGRFLQRDPLGYADGQNLYAGYFVPGTVDPSGKELYLFATPTRLATSDGNREFVENVLGALGEACPCFDYSISPSELTGKNVKPNMLKTANKISISQKEGNDLCDCLGKHAGGCRLIFDLISIDPVIIIEERGKRDKGYFKPYPRGNTLNPPVIGTVSWEFKYSGRFDQGSTSILVHELFHGWSLVLDEDRFHALGGDWNLKDLKKIVGGIRYGEIITTLFENQVLEELGKTPRPGYNELGDLDGKGEFTMDPCNCEEVKEYLNPTTASN